ncbi:MAG: GNAT family N-acetyltransferase [Hymenobacter sp.]|nr:GNAT family N-acetyltransferase [Hymenobacter sp.]
MPITYSLTRTPEVDEVIALYQSAGLRRPLADRPRMVAICHRTDLWATAWDGERLVGAARNVTDFRWSCYLADLAVHADYQRQGIGQRLIADTKQHLGEECMVQLLSVATALDYYPKVGMSPVNNGFILNRTR